MSATLTEHQLDALAREHRLNDEEILRMKAILGRVPTVTEVGMFSVMWSEHCSYKNSIAELKKLPKEGGRVMIGAGEENAGLVDIGDGLAVAFKIESHNHPSAVEPYQGAATGVGGIMRDIFTMGARPIAALNSLRFGNPDHPRTNFLLKGVVKGIGDYGNSFGVPTVAGDVFFDDCYNENPLVNAMAVGVVEHAHIATGAAKGPGNLVMIVGSSTGRDGIHGATFASDELSEESESKRPSVQVGDPFTEKLLLEATLEAVAAGLVVGVQDMGAAGITCSTTEMSARGKCGMEVDLARVPLRESGMTPYEIMLSESQERMLMIIEPSNEVAIRNIFSKWDLHCEVIGVVTASERVLVKFEGEVAANVPAGPLTLGGGAPVYHREFKTPEYIAHRQELDPETLPVPFDLNSVLLTLLRSPNIRSRRFIFEQYDRSVRTGTVVSGTGDAAVIRLDGTEKALAVKTDCNPRWVYLDPYVGAQIAVAESARNVVCCGATPIAITNCLNFGNPYDPEIFYQFRESVRGISDACKALRTPVTGGNVSFYNESSGKAIYPTPVIGMLGIMDSLDRVLTADFKDAGDKILLLGNLNGHIGGSEYLKIVHGRVAGGPPPMDLGLEVKVQELILALNQSGLLKSCHDISEGGLAIALAECCIFAESDNRLMGAEITFETSGRPDFQLFGEDQSVVVATCSPEALDGIQSAANEAGILATILGTVGGERLTIGSFIDIPVRDLAEAFYRNAAGVGE